MKCEKEVNKVVLLDELKSRLTAYEEVVLLDELKSRLTAYEEPLKDLRDSL